MFDQLINLVKKHAGDAIISNPSIPNEKNDEVIQDASGSIMNGLQGLVSQGGMNDVLKMFTGQKSTNAVSQQSRGDLFKTSWINSD